jgi:hypothetical protein
VGQRLLWLMDHYRGRENSLNEQVLWHLREECDRPALQAAVDALTARHDALRTTFTVRRRQLMQIVHEPRSVPIRELDLSGQADPRQAARRVIAEELRTPIESEVWPTRVTLIRLAAEHHIVVLTMHHYVSDDWSNGLLQRDLRALYRGDTDLPEVAWQYPDWAAWHHGVLESPRRAVLADYWSRHLAGATLPSLPEKASVPRAAGEPGWLSYEVSIPAEVTAGLRRLARTHRTTLFPVMLALFYQTLHQLTGQSDLTVASLFANRDRPEVRDTVGFFVTMVLLRCRVGERDLVTQARDAVMNGMRHCELPLQLLPPGVISGPGRTDDVMFQLIGSFMQRADMEGEELDDLEAQLERRRFALEFVVVPQGEGLNALVLCDRDRFDPQWARRCVDLYAELAHAVAVQGAKL